ncbi:MAG: hypothetical protein EBZ61_10610 [Micrococcales bacterium]|nr:hypothetical protein [Micrococcales bacterium]
MAHYAFLDHSNCVTDVITGRDEGEEGIDWEQWYGEFRGQVCKRTSYNTYAGEHRLGGEPFRKNYAGIGYTYDAQRDAFIPPKPFASWVLNESPQVDKPFYWDDNAQQWVVIDDNSPVNP